MIDAQQWMIGLVSPDALRLIGGLLIVISLIEFLRAFKGWIRI